MNHEPRWKSGEQGGHTGIPGECQWQAKEIRQSVPRQGAAPREPRKKASGDITQGLPGRIHGQELGADGEMEAEALRQLEQLDREDRGGHASSSSSDPRPASGGADEGPPSKDARRRARARGIDIDADFDPTSLGYRPRNRKKWTTTGAGEGEPRDWTSFDLRRVVRTLQAADMNTCKMTLRKLHLRWWHAQAQPMQKLLERVGVRREVLNLVPDIVDTCVACRAWARPLPDAQASVELADTFNQQVEGDLLFLYDKVVFHLLDRCTRFVDGSPPPQHQHDGGSASRSRTHPGSDPLHGLPAHVSRVPPRVCPPSRRDDRCLALLAAISIELPTLQ